MNIKLKAPDYFFFQPIGSILFVVYCTFPRKLTWHIHSLYFIEIATSPGVFASDHVLRGVELLKQALLFAAPIFSQIVRLFGSHLPQKLETENGSKSNLFLCINLHLGILFFPNKSRQF